jgi:hypothetical protein
MIPSDWTPYHRESDGELVGYLVADGTDRALEVPTSLIGLPLGPAQSADSARSVLVARGLAVLAERWWCRLPQPLPASLTTVGEPDPGWGWRPVVLVEVSPAGSRIRIDMASPEELRIQISLPNPVGGLLRPRPPE